MTFTSLTTNADFRRAYYKGKSFVTPYFVMYFLKNRTGETKMGITVSKKLGNAVERNRAKRVLAAAFRETAPSLKKGYNIVLVARTRILDVKSTFVLNLMKKTLHGTEFINEQL